MLGRLFVPIPLTVWLIILLYSEHLEAVKLPETIIVNSTLVIDSDKHNITSPNFPGCCESMLFVLRIDDAFFNYYWKIIFTDVDLPEDSELSIDGQFQNGGERILVRSAKFHNGVWSHPVVSFQGRYLVIVYNPGKPNENDVNYVGFKATYWLDKERWISNIPYTDCPVIENIQKGRIVVREIDETKLPSGPQNYMVHCIWQFKPLKGKRKRFITIDEISPDSNVEIHRGVNSADPVIFSTSTNGKNQNKTFTSNKGFYISLKKRNVGRFVLSYRSGLETPDEMCPKGRCQNGECPKYEHHTCPELPCPWRRKRCEGTIYCIKYSQRCAWLETPDETCPKGRCQNGECPKYDHQTCPELPCPDYKKRCEGTNGTMYCIKYSQKCPGLETPDETCPKGRCQNGECPKYDHHTCPELPCPKYKKRCEGTMFCIKYSHTCPGEKCHLMQSKCLDGLCINIRNGDTCPDGSKSCGFADKRCKNGDCAEPFTKCPEDQCPPDRSFKCGDQCISESLKCDGVRHCKGGQDERYCIEELDFDDIGIGKEKETKTYFNWKHILAIFGCVPFLVFCCYSCCNYNSKKRSPPPQEGVSLSPQNLENQPYRNPLLTATPATYDPLSTRHQLLNTYPVDIAVDQADSNLPFLGPRQRLLTPPSSPQTDFESEPPSAPLLSIVTDNPPVADSSPPATPPPPYGVVMSNQDFFLPPPNYESVVANNENETNT